MITDEPRGLQSLLIALLDGDTVVIDAPSGSVAFGLTSCVSARPPITAAPIVLSEVTRDADRTVQLLETPFRGYGRIGHDAIDQVVADLPGPV